MSIELQDGERLVTVYAERASGPGWSNSPIWVVIAARDGVIREECLQPQEQSVVMLNMYRVAAEVNEVLTSEVKQLLRKGPR